MYIEYKIAYKRPDLRFWGELGHGFTSYADAETELEKLEVENGSGEYKIIKVIYETVKEEEVN